MDDRFTDLNREEKKQKLRSRVIDTPEVDYQAKLRKHRMVLALVGAGILLVVMILMGIYFYRENIRHFDGCEVITSYDLSLTGDYTFVPFGENVLYYGKNGASYMNAAGEVVWTKAYEMSNPMVEMCGDYAAIADQTGNTIVICDVDGYHGTVTTALPISRISIAQQGMVAAILEDDVANYITFYNEAGMKLNIEIKTVISGNGYPLAISLSPSGESLMVSYVGVEGEGIKNKVLFYNFNEGQDQVDKLIAGFEHYEDTLVARTHFFDEEHAVAVGDDRLTFFEFSTSNTVKISEEIELENEICYTLMSESYLGIVYQEKNGDAPYRIVVYDRGGRQVMDMAFDFGYDTITFAGNELMMYNRSGVVVYYLDDGTVKFRQELESNYDIILPGVGKNEYYTIGSELMQILKPAF